MWYFIIVRVPWGCGSQISRQSAHESGKVVSPTHRPPLPPRTYSWYLFLLGAESSPACSTVPQPTAPQPTPFLLINAFFNCRSLQPPQVVISHCVICYWFCPEISFILLLLPNCITTSTRNLFFAVVIVTVEHVCYCNHFLPFYVPKYIALDINISHISRGHCEGHSRGREVGLVSRGWLASTVFSTHNGLDRWTSGLCCRSVLWEQPFCDSDSESVLYTLRARSKRPCDFFLWGYLKEKVFKHSPRSLEDVKERIQHEIDSIPPELTRRVMKNFRERLQQCVATDGRHTSDIIFKTH